MSKGSSATNRGGNGTYPNLNESSSYYQNYEARQSRSRSFTIVPAAMKDAFVYEASVDSRVATIGTPDSVLSELSDASSMESVTAATTGTAAPFLPSAPSSRPSLYTEPEPMYQDTIRPQNAPSATPRVSFHPPPPPPQQLQFRPPVPPPPASSAHISPSSSSSTRRPSLSVNIPTPPAAPESRPHDATPFRTSARMDTPVTAVRSDRPRLDRSNSSPLPPRQPSDRPLGARRESDPIAGMTAHQHIAEAHADIRVQEAAPSRSVRWNEDLICPSPILPSQRRKGWYNRRGYVPSQVPFSSDPSYSLTPSDSPATNSGPTTANTNPCLLKSSIPGTSSTTPTLAWAG